MTESSQQLLLPVQPTIRQLADFHQGSNAWIEHSLYQGDDWLYIVGAKESGKTHLLQSFCIQQLGRIYLSTQMIDEIDVFSIGQSQRCIVLDDVDQAAGLADKEEKLFHLYNRCMTLRIRMIFSAKAAPSRISWQVSDLKSRLQRSVILELEALDDTQIIKALQSHASVRGWKLPDPVGQYLLHRCCRGWKEMLDMLDSLDQYMLIHRRSLTIPLARQWLSEQQILPMD